MLAPLPLGADPNSSFRGAFVMAPWANRLDRGLLPVAGVPMLVRVVSALRGSPAVGRVVVSVEAPGETLAGLGALGGVLPRDAAPSPGRIG